MKNFAKIIIVLFLFIISLTMVVSVSASEYAQTDEYDILLSSLGIANTSGALSMSEITTTDGSPITTEEKFDTTFHPVRLKYFTIGRYHMASKEK